MSEENTAPATDNSIQGKANEVEQEVMQISAQLVDAQRSVESLKEVRAAKIEVLQTLRELAGQ